MRKKHLMFVSVLLACSVFSSGCSTYRYCIGKTIRPGTSYTTVYILMGRPYIGFGMPRKNTDETSWLYYKIPFEKYLVVHFKGYFVDDPPTSIESRDAIVY